jgi:hypothetical protein
MSEFYHAASPMPAGEGMPHCFIATPSTQLYGNHFAAIVKALPILVGAGVACDHYLLTGMCHIDDGRNMCVSRFLQTKCTDLIFIDADVGFPPEALYRLAMHKGDIVAGVYPRKDINKSYPCKVEPGPLHIGEDGVIREGVIGLPTGFMKISRRVLERMAEERVDRMFKAEGDGANAPLVPIIFERGYEKGNRLSGDIAFCMWASELGFELALDPMLAFTHAGEMKFYGRMIDDLAPPTEEAANGV